MPHTLGSRSRLGTANAFPLSTGTAKTAGGWGRLLRKAWVFGPPLRQAHWEEGRVGRTPASAALSTVGTCSGLKPRMKKSDGGGGGRAACGGDYSATENSLGPLTDGASHRPVTPELEKERLSTAAEPNSLPGPAHP